MADPGKRPIFVIDTARKSKEEMKAAARDALQRFQESAKPEAHKRLVADEVAFTVEIEGQEPSPHPTLQDATHRVEGYETPTGAIFYTLYGARQPVVVYRDGDIELA